MLATLVVLGCADRAPSPPPDRRVPVLFQRNLPACLAYATAAVARFHGHDVEPETLHRAVPVTAAGVAWTDVTAALADRGIEATLFRPARDELCRLVSRPGAPLVIGQVRGRKAHAIVVERCVADRGVYREMDPANPGRREQPAEAVDASFVAAGRNAIRIHRAAVRAIRP